VDRQEPAKSDVPGPGGAAPSEPALDAGSSRGPWRPADPAIEVLEAGLLTTVQGGPRHGYRRFGVAAAGALDPAALAQANLVLGNAAAAAGLECTVAGPVLRFLRPLHFALAGADLGARLERADLGSWSVPRNAAVLARAGNVLRFDGRISGCRAYLCFEGGIDVPLVLGSVSTDLLAGLGGTGGRALASGDALGLLARAAGRAAEVPLPAQDRPVDEATVRVIPGPQDDHFPREALACLLEQTFSVTPSSDRVACRLEGAILRHLASSEIVSDGMVPGSIQVPPDGRPIVMLADGPTTGGYPKIATVISADLPLLAQLLPGAARLRFALAAGEEA
jgi:antagonist of KipI